MSFGVRLSLCVCVSAALVSAAKVMRCIQCSVVRNPFTGVLGGINQMKDSVLCTNLYIGCDVGE